MYTKTEKLKEEFRSYLRYFAFWVGNGTLIIRYTDFDYTDLLLEQSDSIGQIFAIFVNVWREIDRKEIKRLPLYKDPAYRAGQWLRKLCNPRYKIKPEFEPWETRMTGLSLGWKQEIVDFALLLGQKKLEPDLLSDIDYLPSLLGCGSNLEAVFAVLGNVILIDENSNVTNSQWVKHRAAQCVKDWLDPSYSPEPPFYYWEIELL